VAAAFWVGWSATKPGGDGRGGAPPFLYHLKEAGSDWWKGPSELDGRNQTLRKPTEAFDGALGHGLKMRSSGPADIALAPL
jgi:hypothetical protein